MAAVASENISLRHCQYKLAACCRATADPYAELKVAADEQMKITELRLAKLLGVPATGGQESSPSEATMESAVAQADRESANLHTVHAAAAARTPATAAAERRTGRLRAHLAQSEVVPAPASAAKGEAALTRS